MQVKNKLEFTLSEISEHHSDMAKMRNILSYFDHYLVDLLRHDRLQLFSVNYYETANIPLRYKVYFVALTEYFYNLYDETPPEWVHDSQYMLPELTYPEIIEDLCVRMDTQEFKRLKLERAIPEFLKRNLVETDILTAV